MSCWKPCCVSSCKHVCSHFFSAQVHVRPKMVNSEVDFWWTDGRLRKCRYDIFADNANADIIIGTYLGSTFTDKNMLRTSSMQDRIFTVSCQEPCMSILKYSWVPPLQLFYNHTIKAVRFVNLRSNFVMVSWQIGTKLHTHMQDYSKIVCSIRKYSIIKAGAPRSRT